MEVVDREMLKVVARMKPALPHEDRSRGSHGINGQQGFDLVRWIEEHEVPVKREGDWSNGGHRYVLEECPWNGHTDNSAHIVKHNNGAIAAGCHHNSCQEYGWRDLREHYEPGCYDRRGIDHAGFIETGGPATELPSAPPFPLAALPPTLRTVVEEAARAIGCPPEFIAVPMLATLGAAIGNSRVLELKRGWTEGAALYAAVVADPGAKKTPATGTATRPTWKRQWEHEREYEEAMAEYRSANEEEEREEEPEEPTLRRTVVEDATVESLIDRLGENPRGLLCAKDELSGWVRALDQYKGGRGADRQFYLSVWSNRSVIVDRKSRKKPLMVPRPFVGLTGSIQPKILSELKNDREDGLLDRFLFAYPNPTSSRWSDDEIGDEVATRYRELYDRLYGLGLAFDLNGEPEPRRVNFTPEAKKIYVREADSLREEMERPGFPYHLKGPWSKMEAYLARLSLILALARIVEAENALDSFEMVTEQDVRAAAQLVAYFKAHARRVYAELHGEKPEYLLGEALKVFLGEEGGNWEGQTSQLYEVLEGPLDAGAAWRQGTVRQAAQEDHSAGPRLYP